MNNINTEGLANMGIHAKAKLMMKPADIDTHESDLSLRANDASGELAGYAKNLDLTDKIKNG